MCIFHSTDVLNIRCRLLLVFELELDAGPVARTTSAVGQIQPEDRVEDDSSY